jgi:hypothetical protein
MMNDSNSIIFEVTKSNHWPFKPIPKKKRRLLLGFIVSGAGFVIAMAPVILIIILGNYWSWYSFLMVLASIFAICPWGVFLYRIGDRMRLRPAVSLLERDGRRPVIFLRSFHDEYVQDRTAPSSYRYEEVLCKALKAMGPPIAIGRPQESLPETGAARLYVRDEDWRIAVNYFMKIACAVVIIVGRSEGIWWEIEEALRSLQRQKILFCFPYFRSSEARQSAWRQLFSFRSPFINIGKLAKIEDERQKRYVIFRERVNEFLSSELPEKLGSSQFLDFQLDDTPRLLPTIRPSIVINILQASLTNPKIGVNYKRTLKPFMAKY